MGGFVFCSAVLVAVVNLPEYNQDVGQVLLVVVMDRRVEYIEVAPPNAHFELAHWQVASAQV
jgi:hypothetical protein